MESFTDLNAWQKGMELIEEIYSMTKMFPKEEQYGLTSQLRRANVSILANLAEGFSRSTDADKAHKYTIARGECSEVLALLLISIKLGYVTEAEASKALKLAKETGRLLSGLIQRFAPNPSPIPNP